MRQPSCTYLRPDIVAHWEIIDSDAIDILLVLCRNDSHDDGGGFGDGNMWKNGKMTK